LDYSANFEFRTPKDKLVVKAFRSSVESQSFEGFLKVNNIFWQLQIQDCEWSQDMECIFVCIFNAIFWLSEKA